MRRLVLQPGRDVPVRRGHPWIFSRAIREGLDGAEPGEPVRIVSAGGGFVAVGYANPRTTIAARVVSLDDEPLDAALVDRRVAEALALRRQLLPPDLTAYRVLNGEGDFLPGVVVDRYGDVLVCQFLTAGAARLAPEVVAALESRLAPQSIVERSEGGVRAEEGLPGARGLLAGTEPAVPLAIAEGGATLLVDVLHGQKTGFFLDQRDTRALVARLTAGRRVLNAFAYTGAMSVAAGRGGATEVVSVDTSAPALAFAREAWAANGLPEAAARFVCADVFEFLREEREPFDCVILDPPPFVRRRRDLTAGLRAYKDVNLQAMRRLAPGGWLVTCSCSQHLGRAAFREVVAAAAGDAGCRLTLVGEAGHPVDHPVALAHPEGEYLKVLLLRAEGGT
ncbi:MAG TPA: class I SAM-dependent rRNA methyltransferase [Candidatus Limnocylindria bacterium]|nr:class I SAM-dependent rRNA methyltransferase [Candidatus Limnocylindria bacterium]